MALVVLCFVMKGEKKYYKVPKQTRGGAPIDFKEFTRKSKKSTKLAMKWLMAIQNKDGGYGVEIGAKSDIACSAMVGLALMSQGYFPSQLKDEGKIQQKILDYILKRVATMPQNDITPETGTQIQRKIGRHAHTFFACLYLSQIYGQTEPHQATITGKALAKLVKVIERAQLNDGSWNSGRSWAPVLGTVMGWESLHGAKSAAIYAKDRVKKTEKYLISKMKLSGRGGWMHQLYKNVAGIRVSYAMGNENHPKVKASWESVLQLINRDNTAFIQAGGEEYLAFHLITECMIQRGGASWKRWYPTVRDKMIDVQNFDGSWQGRHCITSRVFCTACAVLVLVAPNRYLPISDW